MRDQLLLVGFIEFELEMIELEVVGVSGLKSHRLLFFDLLQVVRNVDGYSNIFALLFPIARLDFLPICISHPISTLLLYSFSNRKSSIVDSYFQFLLWFSSSPHS